MAGTTATAAMTVVRANMPVATSTWRRSPRRWRQTCRRERPGGIDNGVARTPMATTSMQRWDAVGQWQQAGRWQQHGVDAADANGNKLLRRWQRWTTTVWTPSTPMATSFEAMAAWTTTAWTPSMPVATSFGATAASMTAWCPARSIGGSVLPRTHSRAENREGGLGHLSVLWHRHARDTCGQVAPQTRR